MRPYLISSISLLAICLFSCQGPATDRSSVAPTRATTLLDPVFDAHGSIERWKEQRTLQFNLGGTNGEDFTVDLWSRHERISGKGYTLGYDGNEYWSDVQDTAVGEKNAKFLINLQFYFFAMPFVLADEGVYLEDLPDRTIGGKTYRVVKATFGDGVGVAPKDQYLVYFDPETKRMEYLLYSVTYFNPDNAEKYGALHYHTWQDVDGLLLPKSATRYRWNDDQQVLGESRGEKVFASVSLSMEANPRVFYKKKQ